MIITEIHAEPVAVSGTSAHPAGGTALADRPAVTAQEGTFLFPLIRAVTDGLQRGLIIRDREHDPRLVFVLGHCTFGQVAVMKNPALIPELLAFLYEDVRIPAYFHIYAPRVDLLEASGEGPFKTRIRDRQQFKYLSGIVLNERIVPDGYTLHPLTEETIRQLGPFSLDIGNRFWPSEASFLENGYGTCCLDAAGMPAAVCYSACVAGGVAEIDVFTLPDHRGKGLAEACARAFINASLSRGIVPNWDCFTENTASLRIPHRLAFTRTRQYTFLSLFNGGRDQTH